MGRGESITKPTNLTKEERQQIFDRTAAKVIKEYFDPNYNGTGWPARARERRESIVAISDPDAFELDDAPLLGTPEEIIARLKRLEAGGVENILFAAPGASVAGLRTFAEEIMPAFDAKSSMAFAQV